MKQSELLNIPLGAIEEPTVALRGVDREAKDGKYKHLVESVRKDGILNAISVRRLTEPANGKEFMVCDGLQRYSAAVDAGLTMIPAIVLDATDAESLRLQIVANVQKIETRPVQYAAQLIKLMGIFPEKTIEQWADDLSKSRGWVEDQLRLHRLPKSVQTMVDDGEIPASSAYIIAKFPVDEIEEMEDWADRARTMPPDELIPAAANRVKDLIKAARGQPKPAEVQVPIVRKKGEILEEYNTFPSPTNDYEKGKKETLEWVVRMDDVSQKEWRDARAKEASEKADRKAAREAKKGGGTPAPGAAPSLAALLGDKPKPTAEEQAVLDAKKKLKAATKSE